MFTSVTFPVEFNVDKFNVAFLLPCAPLPRSITAAESRDKPVSPFQLKTVPLGICKELEIKIGFVIVPATAGQVIVADPLVDPFPVITQLVVPAIPQLKAVRKAFVYRWVASFNAMELSAPGKSGVFTATAARLDSAVFAKEPVVVPLSVSVQVVPATTQLTR